MDTAIGTIPPRQIGYQRSWSARLRAARDWFSRNRIRILTYHSISSTPGDRLAIDPERFSAQMQYLADCGYDVISLERACELLGAEESDRRRKIVLTFDDGYRDFVTTAAPVLRRFGFSATLFLVFGDVGGQARWNSHAPQRPLLSPDELRQVKAMGFALGSHTMTHPDLTTLSDHALEREVAESRDALADAGERFAAFAYPGGRFTPREVAAVERGGYDCAVIVGGRWGNGPETNRWRLQREPVLAADSLEWFGHRVSGYYELHYLWARARRVQTR